MIEYNIIPRYTKTWLGKPTVRFDLFKRERKTITDEMFDFYDYMSNVKIASFNSFEAANEIKKQLEIK